eukprot:5686279-Pyramimonas_sp.AAC.1
MTVRYVDCLVHERHSTAPRSTGSTRGDEEGGRENEKGGISEGPEKASRRPEELPRNLDSMWRNAAARPH